MSETAKIRLVRCPKCENLLPEVTDYSVYQCGGCGAVLRAKNKGVIHSSEKSDEVRIGGTAEKLTDDDKMVNVLVGRAMEMSDGSESDVKSSISSSSRVERSILRDGDDSNKESLANKEERMAVNDYEDHQVKNGRDSKDLTTFDGNGNGNGNGETEEKSNMKFWRAQRMEDKVVMDCSEGPSNPMSRHSYGNETVADEFNNVGSVERERTELLKKLDELKDQLSRSGNLIGKGKEKVPVERRMACQDPYWHSDPSLEMNRVVRQNPYPDARFVRPPMHRQEIGGRGFYPHVPGYGDPSRSQMHRSGPYGASAPYQMYQSHPYRLGPYPDDGIVYVDHMEPYPPHFSRHHPSCTCYHCRQKQQLVNPMVPAAYADVPTDRVFGYHDNPGSFASCDYNNQRLPNAHPVRSRNAHTRWPSDVDNELDGFVHRRPPRVHLLPGGKHCRPMAGGAPFLTCYNCFELLLLPERIFAKEASRKKMTCGACSTLIIFTVSNGNLIISYDIEAKDHPEEVEDLLMMQDGKHPNQVRTNRTTFSSEDYDNYGYDFNSTGRESDQGVTGQGRANRSTESNNRHSTSTYTSEADEDWESTRKDSIQAEMSTKNKVRSPPLGSSLQDHFEHSNRYHVANRSREGNRSGRSEHEKASQIKTTTSRQISAKESSATEIDISSNEFGNTGTTIDSGEGIREGDQQKVSKVAESFFAGIIKKSFKDKSNDSLDQERASVTINGHLIPNRVVKKAEKVTGVIQPGHYWYDFRAGFWGIMGGPCLGIIPPYIEEFNYPMPENCAGGNTGVFVNGRELNQKDLTLLGSRGLPTERDRSYIIEISGRVLDEDTGEELDGLGKLAPTVERMKRGFGMKAPKAAA